MSVLGSPPQGPDLDPPIYYIEIDGILDHGVSVYMAIYAQGGGHLGTATPDAIAQVVKAYLYGQPGVVSSLAQKILPSVTNI